MSFNPDLTKQVIVLLFPRKRSREPRPPLYFNDQIVASANDYKNLGIVLDCKSTFAKHTREIIAKARKGIGLIRHLSSHVSIFTLDQMNKMFVRPHLCDVIYHLHPHQQHATTFFSLQYLMRSIDNTQYLTDHVVSGAWKGTDMSKLYKELGWEYLSERR